MDIFMPATIAAVFLICGIKFSEWVLTIIPTEKNLYEWKKREYLRTHTIFEWINHLKEKDKKTKKHDVHDVLRIVVIVIWVAVLVACALLAVFYISMV